MPTTDAAFTKLPFRARLLNASAESFGEIGWRFAQWRTRRSRTRAETEIAEVGIGEERLVARLKNLVACFEQDRGLTFIGRRGLRGMLREGVARFAALEKTWRNQPEILETSIRNPVFVTGFGRSGTTLLQNLLLLHPGCRWLRSWEQHLPFPSRPGNWGTNADPRLARSRKLVERARKEAPEINNIHAWDSPEECWVLLLAAFGTAQIFIFFGLENMARWYEGMNDQDWCEVYRLYKRQLQLLMWEQPGTHWVLKSPDHLIYLDRLMGLFPDAKFIQLHRDPKKVIPSACSLICHFQSLFRKRVDPKEVGRQVIAIFSGGSRRNVMLRKAMAPGSVFDLPYLELAKAPVESVERFYAHAGMEMPSAMKEALHNWKKQNDQRSRPPHKYSLEQFGLTAEQVNSAFEEYVQYFNVQSE
jgi:Sulfotransferase family